LTIQRKRVAKRLASGLLAGALALGGLAISGGSVSAKTPGTTGLRIQGADRYGTSVAIATKFISSSAPYSNAAWATSANLILASGESASDALSASALSKAVNAPILLVKKDSLPSSVRDWLLTNSAAIGLSTTGKVYVVGGPAAISESVVTAVLSTINGALDPTPHTAERLGGDNRYETAKKVNAVSGIIGNGDAVILVNGENWPDAVSASPLSYKAGWPIVPVKNGVIDNNGLATITAAATANGATSAQKFLIVGGKSAVPESVETQLMAAGATYANIRRIAGTDRYDTAYKLNVAMYSGLAKDIYGQSLDGSKIALVTGEGFADALAVGPLLGQAGIHGMLTTSGALGAKASGLIAAVATYSKANPTSLFAIGGSAAISADAYSAGTAAAKSVDVAFTSMICTEGSTSIFLTFNEGESTYGTGADAMTTGERAAIQAAFSQDGIAIATTGSITALGVTAGYGASFFDLDGNGVNDAIGVALSGALSVTNGISTTLNFAGVTEATAGQARAFGTASCTVGADLAGPVLTFDARKNASAAVTTIYVKGNEDLNCTNANISKLTLGATTAVTAWQDVTVSANSSDAKSCSIALDPVSMSGLSAATVISAAAGFLKDTAGKDSVATGGTVTIQSDLVAPVQTTSSVVCIPSNQATKDTGTNGLTVTAIDAAVNGGTKDGPAGNGYDIQVVAERGRLIPSVTIDDAAKKITVVADIKYHTADDVKQWVANNAITGDWAFAKKGDGTLSATLVPTLTTAGAHTCTATINFGEYLSAVNIGSVVVNGLSLAEAVGPSAGEYAEGVISVSASGTPRIKVSMKPTTAVSPGSIVISGSVTDYPGNANAAFAVTI